MALGMLGQKLKASHHIEGEEERVQPWHPQVPLAIRVAVEREARRMAGYLYGRRIANQFLEMFESDPKGVEPTVRAYLEKQEDPRLAEIVGRLLQVAQAHAGAS
jgi:hypothetical protein